MGVIRSNNRTVQTCAVTRGVFYIYLVKSHVFTQRFPENNTVILNFDYLTNRMSTIKNIKK